MASTNQVYGPGTNVRIVEFWSTTGHFVTSPVEVLVTHTVYSMPDPGGSKVHWNETGLATAPFGAMAVGSDSCQQGMVAARWNTRWPSSIVNT